MDLIKTPPKLIVGLGNPGTRYNGTRHNVGFLALDTLAAVIDAKWKEEKKYHAAKLGDILLIKPTTYMNLSGEAVMAAMTKHKIKPDEVLVIHDELDLPTGELRAKVGGGAAGHNGLKSIDAAIGQGYARIRIGISHPRQSDSPLSPADWVLARFHPEELPEIKAAITQILVAFSQLPVL